MGIPVGEYFHCTLSGVRDKEVICEHCQHEYAYRFRRVVTGSGFSFLFLDTEGAQQRAQATTEVKLEKSLEQGIELVPCPKCGHYQQSMKALAQDQYYPVIRRLVNWLVVASLLGIVGAIVWLISNDKEDLPLWSVIVPMCVLLSCVPLTLLRSALCRLSDPNQEPVESRLQVAALAIAKFPSPLYDPSESLTSFAADDMEFHDHLPKSQTQEQVIHDLSLSVSDLSETHVDFLRQQITLSEVFWSNPDSFLAVFRGSALILIAIGIPLYDAKWGKPAPRPPNIFGGLLICGGVFGLGAFIIGSYWRSAQRSYRLFRDGTLIEAMITGDKNWEGSQVAFHLGGKTVAGRIKINTPVTARQSTWVVVSNADPTQFACLHDMLILKLKSVRDRTCE